MKNVIRHGLLVLALSATATTALAGPQCTTAPEKDWQNADQFERQLVEQGYQIKVFKTSGSCYEIYGHNKEGKRVEIYFNPVDGAIVKSED